MQRRCAPPREKRWIASRLWQIAHAWGEAGIVEDRLMVWWLGSPSVGDLERRAVLRPRAPMIVDARGGDVGVTEPFLHLGDVGLQIGAALRLAATRAAAHSSADQKPKLPRIAPHQTIDAVRSDRALQPAGVVVADRPEQRAGLVEGMPDGVEIVVDQAVGAGMQRQGAPAARAGSTSWPRRCWSR